MRLTWFHLPPLAEGVSGDNSVLFLDGRNARDIGNIAEHFRALAYVVRAVPRRQNTLQEPRSEWGQIRMETMCVPAKTQIAVTILLSVFTWVMSPRAAIAEDPYQSGELIVLFEKTAHSVIEAALTASRANQTTIGVAEFDSIGVAHSLQSIEASPQADVSDFSRRLYTLVFPEDADIMSIAMVYSQLSYVASAEANFIVQIATVLEGNTKAVAQEFTLDQNHPNPFNPVTAIRFALPNSDEIELVIYSLTGQKVATLANGYRAAGTYMISWDGRDDDGRALASGVYVYKLMAADGAYLARKMLILR